MLGENGKIEVWRRKGAACGGIYNSGIPAPCCYIIWTEAAAVYLERRKRTGKNGDIFRQNYIPVSVYHSSISKQKDFKHSHPSINTVLKRSDFVTE